MPLDVAKTRLQMQGADGTQQYKNLVDCFKVTVRKEGIASLYKGVEPALARQVIYGGLRYGLYAPLRNLIGVDPSTPKDQIPFWKKFVAGGGAGGLASFAANPTDLVKIRMQVDGLKAAEAGYKPKYTGAVNCVQTIYKDEGILAFWKGSTPNLSRAVVLAAFELSCYDEIKLQLVKAGLVQPGAVSGVFISSCCVGFIASVVSTPFDVVKSRIMGQPSNPDGTGKLYSGMVDCFAQTLKKEGPFAMMKGFLPCWARIGPRGVIIFMTMEQLKKFAD
jgi:solute carrier family 25 uncoupling protein 8/9